MDTKTPVNPVHKKDDAHPAAGAKAAPVQQNQEETRLIVRINNKDLDGSLPVRRAIMDLKGIGQRSAKAIAGAFERQTGVSANRELGRMSEAQDRKLEEIILAPGKFGLPEFMLNRRKDYETGQSSHLVMSELDFARRKDMQRLNEIRSYRGLRLSWGLPVRGQRTKSTHRGKGATVGVFKKDAKSSQAKAPAAAAAKPAAGKEAAPKKK
ncbi:MAG: 30S ribosomal protein S13 [Candidatus Diapherotrites archaeon]|nr:30S ribosomal protein S13 [Candidatus Diapherotrites archaeon]